MLNININYALYITYIMYIYNGFYILLKSNVHVLNSNTTFNFRGIQLFSESERKGQKGQES